MTTLMKLCRRWFSVSSTMNPCSIFLNSVERARHFCCHSYCIVSLSLTDTLYLLNLLTNDSFSPFTFFKSFSSCCRIANCITEAFKYPKSVRGERAAMSFSSDYNGSSISICTRTSSLSRANNCPTIPAVPWERHQGYALLCTQPLIPWTCAEIAKDLPFTPFHHYLLLCSS